MGHHKQQATTAQTNFTKQSEDREGEGENEFETTPMNKQNSGASADSKEEMINITSCNLSEFSAYMIGQYGEMAFNEGFKIIKANQ